MNGIVKNDVYISALQRTDQGSNLTCQAQNNDITKPAQTTIKINMSCKYENHHKILHCRFNDQLVVEILKFHFSNNACLFDKKGRKNRKIGLNMEKPS